MSDLISRQDALKPFCVAPDGTRIPEVDFDNFPVEFSVKFIKKHLLSLLLADRPIGKWVDDCACSICHWIHEDNNGFALITKYNYCPNCGIKMEDGNEKTK